MDLKRILKQYGIEEEQIENLKDAITKEIGTDFIPKIQYQKKISQLDALQEKVDDYEARENNPNEYKKKYDELNSEFEKFKSNIELEKTNKSKLDLLKSNLKNDGIEKDNLIDLLCKGIDLNSIEVEEGNIKGWEELSKTYKENYADFYTKETLQGGAEPTTPPANNGNQKFTIEQINNMSSKEINENWETISQVLAQQ